MNRQLSTPERLGRKYIEADGETLSRPCYKVITCDKNDEIVDLQASLMVGVARDACV